jgi:hypothetical protein
LVSRDGEEFGLAYGTLYRGNLAARGDGAVFDQRTLIFFLSAIAAASNEYLSPAKK